MGVFFPVQTISFFTLTTQTKFKQFKLFKQFKQFKQFKHFKKTQLKTVLLSTVLRRLVIVKRSFTCFYLWYQLLSQFFA